MPRCDSPSFQLSDRQKSPVHPKGGQGFLHISLLRLHGAKEQRKVDRIELIVVVVIRCFPVGKRFRFAEQPFLHADGIGKLGRVVGILYCGVSDVFFFRFFLF